MCFVECGHKYQLRCMVIAVVSLIAHMCLLCLSVTGLILVKEKDASIYFQNYFLNGTHVKTFFENIDKTTLCTLFGVALAMNVLGVVASVLLLIGSKCNKTGYVAVYLCYILQLSILLLISGILFLLKLQWSLAAVFLVLFGVTTGVIMAVNRFHEDMQQDAFRSQQDSISDITRLIDADSLEDMPAE